MPDPAPAPVAGSAPAPAIGSPPAVAAPVAGDPWYSGIDRDLVGHWQNRGLDLSDPVKLVAEVGKAHREAERHIGVPPNRLVRLPERPDDAAGWKAVWERLGAPKDAKEYDFSGIKYGDEELEPSFVESLRSTFARTNLPKEAATEVTKAVVKYLADADSQEQTAMSARVTEEKAALERNWGPNFHENMRLADEATRRLGLTAADVNAIGEKMGVAKLAEVLRRIGAGTTEATFTEGGRMNGNPTSVEAAISRMNDLKIDLAKKPAANWTAAERQEFKQLNERITGISEAAELARL